MIEYDKYVKQILLFLSLPENEGRIFKYRDVPELAGISKKELSGDPMQKLHSRGFIKGSAGINPDIKISEKGLKEAKEIQQTYFNETGNPLIKNNHVQSSLENTCEILFQTHKSDRDFTHYWTFESYTNRPDNLNAAKDLMVHKKVLFEKSINKSYKTSLNPDAFTANSFQEALNLISKHIPPENKILQQYDKQLNSSLNKIEENSEKKDSVIFISHSSKDTRIAKFFCDKILRLSLGLSPDNIFCSSIEACSIDSGENFRSIIKQRLEKSSYVIQLITSNYKESEVCLNEMGAAWVLNNKVIPFILNPIDFKNVGFIHSVNQLLKLDELVDILKFIDEIGGDKSKLKITEIIRHVTDFTEHIKQEVKIERNGVEKLEIEASFEGDWLNYLLQNINSEIPIDNGAPDGLYIVKVSFKINHKGYIVEAKATTNYGYGMEEEVLRVIKKSPKWKPAFQNNRYVNAYRSQAITFVVE